jgi:hypothetical protein
VTGRFECRRHSWVCSHEGLFFKIPRLEESPGPSLAEPSAIEAARLEYELTSQLAVLDDAIEAPLGRVGACLVKRHIPGVDAVRVARAAGAGGELQEALEAGVSLAGRLHRPGVAVLAERPVYDYGADPYLPAHEAVLERLRSRPRSLVVEGFEVRNFRREDATGRWKFFDPHNVLLGVPEQDFTQYVLSVLMINWGRNVRCRTWTRFDYPALREAYERARGEALDPLLLQYSFRRNVRVRMARALYWANRLGGVHRLGALTYAKIYFAQIRSWENDNAV